MFNPLSMLLAGGGGKHHGMGLMTGIMETQMICETMCYTPRLIYGVKEKDRDKIISSIILDGAPQVQRFASDVVRFHGGNMIYGCEMTVGEGLSGEKMKKMRAVDRFVKRYNLNLGKPKFLVGIKGDYKLDHIEYEPEETTKTTTKAPKDQKPDEDERKSDDKEKDEKAGPSQAKEASRSQKRAANESDQKDPAQKKHDTGKGKERKK
jgi:hypothetical protein